MNFWKEIKKPIIGLSPMDGITDHPMRQVQVSITKPAVIYTEFVSVEGFIRNPDAFKRHLFFQRNESPIVVQLFGYTPQAFYNSIMLISKLGFDGIDINMGCPARKVLGKGGGGALIGNYKLAGEIIEKSLQAIKDSKIDIPLSVKTRIGKKEIETEKWISFLSGFPIVQVTVHGRLLKELNHGPVNWEEIKKAGEILKNKGIVCIGNGGIKSIFEAKEKIKQNNLDGVLIGQAACGNPWVFAGRKPSREEIFETIIKHTKLVSSFFDEKGFCTIYKHFSWYPRGFKNSKKLKVELLKTKNLEEVKKVITSFS